VAGSNVLPTDVRKIETDVGPLLFPADDSVMLPLIAHSGSWELDEAILFRAHLRPGMTVVDIGAHVGYYTLLAARAVGSLGRVVAVEPHPLNAELLRQNVSRNRIRNVEVIEGAASRKPGKLMLEQSSDRNSGDHRVVRATSATTIEVDAVVLDDVLQRIDVGKVDAQGSDHAAVAGMEKLVRRDLPTVFTEFWPAAIRSFGDDPAGVVRYYRALPAHVTMPGVQADFDGWHADRFVEMAERMPGGFGTLVVRPHR
jgi:FkbM family methyltransferase